MKYRKKPVVIEAVQWTGKNKREIANFMQGCISQGGSLFISTLEGQMTASVGDWVIKGVKGELYPCKDEIFRMTYEPADEAMS